MDRNEALAICFTNLKGPRKKDLLATAEALRFLRGLPEFDSNARLGEAVGVSGEMVREFLTLLSLPPAIQQLFKQKPFTLEHGRRLAQLSSHQPERLEEVADSMGGLTALQARDFVDYLLRHRDEPVREAKRRVLDARTITEREYHVVAILPEENYRRLAVEARRRSLSVDRLVTKIVEDWLASGTGNGRSL